MNLDKLLIERGNRYGTYETHAVITQAIKNIFAGRAEGFYTTWDRLSPSQKETLEMIAHKLGRILNGDPNYINSWIDIAGYAQLEVDILQGKEQFASKAQEEKTELIPGKVAEGTLRDLTKNSSLLSKIHFPGTLP